MIAYLVGGPLDGNAVEVEHRQFFVEQRAEPLRVLEAVVRAMEPIQLVRGLYEKTVRRVDDGFAFEWKGWGH